VELHGARVLVTGACGFIGSHLVEELLAAGARVRALVFYSAAGSRGWIDALPPEAVRTTEIVPGDVRDAGLVEEAARGADAIVHLAALVGIPYSYRAPRTTLETNTTGTLNVLEASRRLDTARTVIVSSSEVYGTARAVPIREDHPLQAQSPYAASKIAAEKLAEAYAHSFGVRVVVARPFNTYGPRQSTRAVIPSIAAPLLAGAREVRLGNLSPRRDFVFVRDTARALVALARCDAAVGEAVNIATGEEVAIGDLAERIIGRIAPGARVVVDGERVRPAGSEVERLCGSGARLAELTGFRPHYSLDRGLDETIAWLRAPENLARTRAAEYAV
jgi:NAD dependent epimerase/dehydratase